MARSSETSFYVVDTETTGDSRKGMRVYLWGLTDRKTTFFDYGLDLDSLIYRLGSLKEDNPLVYIHNLKYDGSYILVWLLQNEYTYTERIEGDGQFSAIITDMGLFYEISIGINNKIIKLHDSVKKIPLALEQIPYAYGLDLRKLDFDYHQEVGEDWLPTEQDLEYQKNDVFIPAQALDIQYSQGLTKMTTSADALADYKARIGSGKFKQLYPILPDEVDAFCRKSYKGGITYVKPEIAGKEVGKGSVWDVHSMYPGQMKNELLPYGQPIYLKGDIVESLLDNYPLYIVRFTADFELKKDHMPMVQIKNNFRFNPTDYIEESMGEVELTMTSVDFELFKKQYHIFYLEVHDAYYFKGAKGLFDSYIDYWYGVKSDPETPPAMVTISKLYLNGLYGKFGSSPKNVAKIPYLDEEGALRFRTEEKEDRPTVYVPMASFITAYARRLIVNTAQSLWKYFCYCDTDSVHLAFLPEDIDLNDYMEITEKPDEVVGTWGFEANFTQATFYRAKTYKELIDGKNEVKCAGLSASALENVEYNDFEMGVVFEQLKSRQVKGGVELYLAPFEIK